MEKQLNDLANMVITLSKSVQQLSYALGTKAAVQDIALQILLQQQQPNPDFCARLKREIETLLDTKNHGFDLEIDAAVARSMNALLEAAGESSKIKK